MALQLYTNYWRYWNAFGHILRELYLPLNQYASKVLATSNALVDRIHALGGDDDHEATPPPTLVQLASQHASISDLLNEAHRNLQLVMGTVLEAAHIASEQEDRSSEDLLLRAAALYAVQAHSIGDVLLGMRR